MLLALLAFVVIGCRHTLTPWSPLEGASVSYHPSQSSAAPGDKVKVTLIISNSTSRSIRALDPRDYGWTHRELEENSRSICSGPFHIYDGEDHFLVLQPGDSFTLTTVYTIPDCHDRSKGVRIFHAPYEVGACVVYYDE